MTRSLRQEIIATPIKGMGDGNHTTGRSGLYLSVYINNAFPGGLQSIEYEESGGVAMMRQIGNSVNEPVPQPYEITGTFTRFQLRGKTLRQLMAQIFPNVSGIDWRVLPFDIRMHQFFQYADGSQTVEDTWEFIQDVYVQRINVSQPDPTGYRMETVNFIARGIEESGKDIITLESVHKYELGGAFPGLNKRVA